MNSAAFGEMTIPGLVSIHQFVNHLKVFFSCGVVHLKACAMHFGCWSINVVVHILNAYNLLLMIVSNRYTHIGGFREVGLK